MHRYFTAAAWLIALCAGASAAAAAPAALPSASATLHGQHFSIELATTPAEQEYGLMNRTSMAADHGMLFVFHDTAPRIFWMKNTLIPLDMLFFNAHHKLVAIQADALPCKADPCQLYPSGVPARYVLELNAGTVARLGIRKGDVMTWSGAAAGTQ